MSGAALVKLLNIADFALSALEAEGLNSTLFAARRAQRIQEGHDGLLDTDVDEFQKSLQSDIARLKGQG